MRLVFNASGPSRIEVLVNPGDELEVNPELGNRLLKASPQLVEAKSPPPKPKPKPTRKPRGKGSS